MKETILKEEPVNMPTLKKELERIKKRDGELSLRALKTEEYLNNNTSFKKKDADELFEKLQKLDISRLKELHLHKIIDLAPTNVEELKLMLSEYNITLTGEVSQKIVSLVNDYAPEKK